MSYVTKLLRDREGFTPGLFGSREIVRPLILSGGGIDSWMAFQMLSTLTGKTVERPSVLTIVYGQQNVEVEVEFAKRQLTVIGGERHYVLSDDLPSLLANKTALSREGRAAAAGANESTNNDYVPFRNARFLSMAAGLAEAEGFDTIVFGAVGAVNPDNSLAFIRAMHALIEAGSHTSINIYAPFVLLTKAAVATLAEELDACEDLAELTVSCFNATDYDVNAAVQCGVCRSCTSLKQAFKFASVADPYMYKVA